jgi:hypothetical protein
MEKARENARSAADIDGDRLPGLAVMATPELTFGVPLRLPVGTIPTKANVAGRGFRSAGVPPPAETA